MERGFRALYEHSTRIILTERFFVKWRDWTRLVLEKRESRLHCCMNIVSQSKTLLYFQRWKMQSTLDLTLNSKKQVLLRKLLKQWKKEAKSSSHDWDMKMKQAEKFMSDGKIDLMKNVFQSMVSATADRNIMFRSVAN